jgi:phosphatidylserine decarboxylase
MERLEDWLNREDIRKLAEQSASSMKDFYTNSFSRNPSRTILYSHNKMYSPADGIVLYQKEVDASKEVVLVKGRQLTVQDILEDKDFKGKCIVTGIFMTYLDVHYTRLPLSGITSYSYFRLWIWLQNPLYFLA